jgi:hypothetical protein
MQLRIVPVVCVLALAAAFPEAAASAPVWGGEAPIAVHQHVTRANLTGGSSGSSSGECSDSYYELEDLDYRLEGTFEYYFVASSTPSDVNVGNTETAVKESVTNWTRAVNNCGLADDIGLTSSYKGRSSDGVEITSDGTCKATGDGRSEVGFGTLPSATVATACAWFRGGRELVVIEGDVRLNKAKKWWNVVSTCKGSRYIVEAALTHERGHIFGLTHHAMKESKHGRLSMSPTIDGYCQAAETTLAKGDVLGMRARGY